MSASLHLDLLNDDERFSSSPIRLRVMAPLCGFFLVVGTLVAWMLTEIQARSLSSQKNTYESSVSDCKPAHAETLRLRLLEKEMTASLQQLAFYRASQMRFGETLARLPEHVPFFLQLTELRVPLPSPLIDPLKPALGPTNTFENVTLRLAGKAGGDRPTEAVNALLKALNSAPVFTNLIRSAEIPKGAFRQDTSRLTSGRDMLLFEINCQCSCRRFQ